MQLDVMFGSQDELWVHFNGVGVISSEFKPVGHRKNRCTIKSLYALHYIHLIQTFISNLADG